MQKIETTIASLTKRGEQLAVKRVTAQTALDQAVKARQHALLSADLDDQRALDKVEAAVAAASSHMAGIDDALAVLAQQKAEAERQRPGGFDPKNGLQNMDQTIDVLLEINPGADLGRVEEWEILKGCR